MHGPLDKKTLGRVLKAVGEPYCGDVGEQPRTSITSTIEDIDDDA